MHCVQFCISAFYKARIFIPTVKAGDGKIDAGQKEGKTGGGFRVGKHLRLCFGFRVRNRNAAERCLGIETIRRIDIVQIILCAVFKAEARQFVRRKKRYGDRFKRKKVMEKTQAYTVRREPRILAAKGDKLRSVPGA